MSNYLFKLNGLNKSNLLLLVESKNMDVEAADERSVSQIFEH